MDLRKEVCAVSSGGKWYIARAVPASEFGPVHTVSPDDLVWSREPESSWVCLVGEEEKWVALGDPTEAILKKKEE